MKMDNNLEGNGEESPPSHNGMDNTARQILGDQLTELLEQFTSRVSSNHHEPPESAGRQQPPISGTNHFADILQQVSRNATEGSIVDGIDAASPLGRSLQNKFTELEEISRRLKTRLNQVVCDSDILLSPDGEQNMVDLDLERDLNTDSHAEDLTPQEFYQLVQSQLPSTSECSSSDHSDKSDISK